MTDEKTDRFTRPHGEGKTYSTPRLPMKKGEKKEDFYKRMNELGYGQGDLEKVPHHWNSDDNEMHRGEDSESCKWCKPTKRQQAKLNKTSGEKPKPGVTKEESTTSKDKSSEGGSETSKATPDESKPFDKDEAGDIAEGKYLKKTSLDKLEKKTALVKEKKRKRGRPPKKKGSAKSASTDE